MTYFLHSVYKQVLVCRVEVINKQSVMAAKLLTTALALAGVSAYTKIFDAGLDTQTYLFSPEGQPSTFLLSDRCKNRVCIVVNVASE